MTADELTRMGRRGEEDGHPRDWFRAVAKTRRELDTLIRAADAAKTDAERHQAEFVPSKGCPP